LLWAGFALSGRRGPAGEALQGEPPVGPRAVRELLDLREAAGVREAAAVEHQEPSGQTGARGAAEFGAAWAAQEIPVAPGGPAEWRFHPAAAGVGK